MLAKHSKNVLSDLRDAGYAGKTLVFPRVPVDLHAMIASCGYERRISTDYDWNGLKRGSAEFALMQYTISGKGMLRHERQTHEVLPGRAMLLHFPHDNRYWLPAGSSSWEFIYVCLHGREIMRLWQQIESRAGPLVSLPVTGVSVGALAAIVLSGTRGEVTSPFGASALAYSLTLTLYDELLGREKGPSRPLPIHRAVRFCREHIDRPLTVDDMAAASGYSRFHFTRLFTESEGIAPGQYLRRIRLDRAVTLLQTTALSVKEIAARCGYYDATHFCRVFHATTGLSPRAFRSSGMYAQP